MHPLIFELLVVSHYLTENLHSVVPEYSTQFLLKLGKVKKSKVILVTGLGSL
jgi:hypothetical protein